MSLSKAESNTYSHGSPLPAIWMAMYKIYMYIRVLVPLFQCSSSYSHLFGRNFWPRTNSTDKDEKEEAGKQQHTTESERERERCESIVQTDLPKKDWYCARHSYLLLSKMCRRRTEEKNKPFRSKRKNIRSETESYTLTRLACFGPFNGFIICFDCLHLKSTDFLEWYMRFETNIT